MVNKSLFILLRFKDFKYPCSFMILCGPVVCKCLYDLAEYQTQPFLLSLSPQGESGEEYGGEWG